ncbi:hypothetical protein V5799_026080 [Amblyomma americanum]|uniref:Secreted protein n=1 Tax=Amblyomma americanum TaxID=6943 RepID=A0AAQ4DJM1_AMBAM
MIMITFFLVVALAGAALSDSVHSVRTLAVPAVAGGYYPTVATTPYAVPAVPSAYHQAPTVSVSSRVTSFETARPGVPHAVVSASGYAPALHAIHTSVPTAVPGAVHPVPAYTYVPRYSQRYDANPLRYRYTYGLNPYGPSYGADTIGYVGFG